MSFRNLVLDQQFSFLGPVIGMVILSNERVCTLKSNIWLLKPFEKLSDKNLDADNFGIVPMIISVLKQIHFKWQPYSSFWCFPPTGRIVTS